METEFYIRLDDNKVRCILCPHECIIKQDNSGICKVRKNFNGTLHLDTYGFLSATHFDPVEKKPLYHFHPGKQIYSIGSLGCNFKCSCCQNHQISQPGKNEFSRLLEMSIAEIMKIAESGADNIGVAYTYNEPVVWYEYMLEIAKKVKQKGYKNAVVSNGYINRDPLFRLTEYIDAFNIDLKGFDDRMYNSFAGGKLKNVLNSLQWIKEKDCHLEITFLVVTGVNDTIEEFRKMVSWIQQNLGTDVPLHISRYFPNYKLNAKATSPDLIRNMAQLASEFLHYVYMGNMPGNDFQNTTCPNCHKSVIERDGYSTNIQNLSSEGSCLFCGFNIAIA